MVIWPGSPGSPGSQGSPGLPGLISFHQFSSVFIRLVETEPFVDRTHVQTVDSCGVHCRCVHNSVLARLVVKQPQASNIQT